MEWTQIKSYLLAVEPSAFQGLVDTAFDQELVRYAQFTNDEIVLHPFKFNFQLEDYTLTLDSSGEYDLSTLIPDYQVVNQIHGDVVPGDVLDYRQLTRANELSEGGVWFSIKGKTLLVNGLTSGTVTIQYYSKWLVKDSSGVRKAIFTEEDDVTVLDNPQLLIEGIIRFVKRKLKEKIPTMAVRLYDGRIANLDIFQYQLEQSILNNSPVRGIPTDVRR